MKVYVLVTQDTEGNPTFEMPTHFGRTTRAYASKARAKVYAKKFNCKVVELNLEDGKVV
jgi:hypothetical protein